MPRAIPIVDIRGAESYAIVSDEDYDRVAGRLPRWRWNDDGYVMCGTTGLHRFITGAPKGMVVHHINGIRRDNRRENLAVVTNAENASIKTRPHYDLPSLHKVISQGAFRVMLRAVEEERLAAILDGRAF